LKLEGSFCVDPIDWHFRSRATRCSTSFLVGRTMPYF
jgi:hypothetical protein